MNERDWTSLNLYADGEMTQADAEDFAARLEREPGLAAAYQEVMSARRALKAMFEADAQADAMRVTAAPEAMHDMPKAEGTPRRSRRALSLAAGVAIAAVIAGGTHFIGKQRSGWPDQAASIHAAFDDRNYPVESEQTTTSVPLWRFSSLDIPDLGFSALYFAGLETTRDHLALHYRGVNGCSLTITITESSSEEPQEAEVMTRDGQLFRMWHTAGFRYVVISEGMDRERFLSAARFIRSELEAQTDRRDGLRLAMRDAYEKAAPCV